MYVLGDSGILGDNEILGANGILGDNHILGDSGAELTSHRMPLVKQRSRHDIGLCHENRKPQQAKGEFRGQRSAKP